jgi:hypothetical protein
MSENKYTEPDYVKILRQKLGEFMLTMLDLHQRGVANMKCTFKVDCIESLITALETVDEEKDKNKNDDDTSEYKYFEGTHTKQERIQYYKGMRDNLSTLKPENYNVLKKFVRDIINTQKYHSPIEERLLNVLLVNNGFPCYFSIKNYTDKQPTIYEENTASLYKMHMIIGNISGATTNSPNHFTVEISGDLQNKLRGKLRHYIVNYGKIQIAPDGNCFYTAVAVWCKIYGITEEHLNSITYNVPFDFSKEHFESNLKVPESTTENPIPKPIELPTFKTDALKIASNMKNKIQNEAFRPEFGEPQEIINSSEYKDYDTNGITKDNGTHCNKYKGNKGNKEQKEEVNI